ncbi:MAG: hypothetical protein IT383_28970 [Deltaproteobacteria bacterium]|nr:hypothetical protein [Deltaproteobacteria bacterium]
MRTPRTTTTTLALAAALALAVAGAARAEDPAPAPAGPPPPAPSADEIRKVTDYYLRGKDVGPVLIELVICKKMGKGADGKSVCEEKHGDSIKKGDPLIAFTRFFVPKGGKFEDLKVKFLLNGEVRSTSDFTLQESWTGYGNYKQTTASKAGTWEILVLRGDTQLAAAKVTATE